MILGPSFVFYTHKPDLCDYNTQIRSIYEKE